VVGNGVRRAAAGPATTTLETMKDSIVRGRLLRLLCDRREDGPLPFGTTPGAIPPVAGVDERAWLHALAELADHELVSWMPHAEDTGAMSGLAEITERGVDVCEGRDTPDIAIRFC
jgi:hypothetical protein